jgi:hypothetical protein
MFLLDEITLFYYNITSRAYDKSAPALINNWVAKVAAGGKIAQRTGSSRSLASSTLVSTGSKTKGKGKINTTNNRNRVLDLQSVPVLQFSGKSKPVVQSPYFTLSDEEWLLGGKNPEPTRMKGPQRGVSAVSRMLFNVRFSLSIIPMAGRHQNRGRCTGPFFGGGRGQIPPE